MSTLSTTIVKHPDSVSNQITFTSGGDINLDSGAVFIDSSNNRVGIGTASPANNLDLAIDSNNEGIRLSSSTNVFGKIDFHANRSGADAALGILDFNWNNTQVARIIGSTGTDTTNKDDGVLQFHTAAAGSASEAMRLDSSGRLLHNTTATGTANIIIDSQLGNGSALRFIGKSTNDGSEIDFYADNNTTRLGYLEFNNTVTKLVSETEIPVELHSNSNPRVRIHSTGYMNAGGYLDSDDLQRFNGFNVGQGGHFCTISAYQASGASTQDTALFYGVNTSGGPNSAATAIKIYRNDTTLRSLNLAGTVNTGGNDYAEYMFKAGEFTVAKGDICGVNSQGKLTNVFADAVTFVVKSTDPSYVGGDTWNAALGEEPGGYDDTRTGEELEAAKVAYKEQLEVIRQTVDRIAFSGQTPVNVTGSTPGQHIIPTANSDGSISGTAKSEGDLTLAEYMSSVGKVIAIEEDGRATIIVKVA